MGEIDARKQSPEQIAMAYSTARRIAKYFTSVLQRRTILDFEDYVQEGVLAWLEGRSMFLRMLTAYSMSGKLSRYAYLIKKAQDPISVEFDDRGGTTGVTDSCEDDVVAHIDYERVRDRIMAIKDDTVQFIIMGSLYFGISLRELGTILGMSHEAVRKIRDSHVKQIREEFQC